MPTDSSLISVFPVRGSVLGFRGDWFATFAPKLVHPSYLLMTLMLVIWVGAMALKRFDDADFDRKVLNIPVVILMISFWPALIIGLKDLVDAFDTFLIVDIFKMPWHGFGFPDMGSVTQALIWPAEALARLLPNIAYWILYAFFVVFFFFYAVLGPFVLARGILSDEMETFFALVKEFVTLLLWQTTLILFVAFIMPDIVSGQPLPPQPPTYFYFMSLVLGIMLLFVPTVTRKFARQIEGGIVPLGFRWGGALLGITSAVKLGGAVLQSAGVPGGTLEAMGGINGRLMKMEEFRTRYSHRRSEQEMNAKKKQLEHQLSHDREEEEKAKEIASEDSVVELLKRAQGELDKENSKEKK